MLLSFSRAPSLEIFLIFDSTASPMQYALSEVASLLRLSFRISSETIAVGLSPKSTMIKGAGVKNKTLSTMLEALGLSDNSGEVSTIASGFASYRSSVSSSVVIVEAAVPRSLISPIISTGE